jgi:hypothetical protein
MSKGIFGPAGASYGISEKPHVLQPPASDEPENVNAQKQIIHIAKKVYLFVFDIANRKHEKDLREEQELAGKLSNMIIEIYATESALLRTEKMLHGKHHDKASVPVDMVKVLCHDSLDRIRFLAVSALEALEEGGLLETHLALVNNLLLIPPVNTVALRRGIADSMIGHGRYHP